MKTSSWFSLFLALNVTGAGQVANSSNGANPPTTAPATIMPAPTPYQVVDIGPNHRVWQWQTYEPMPNGQAAPHVHRYIELASGLNYQDSSGQWLPAQEKIEAFAGGAVARLGQYQMIFANNLNSA